MNVRASPNETRRPALEKLNPRSVTVRAKCAGKRWPPFARELRERDTIPQNEILVCAGAEAWSRARTLLAHRAVLVYPGDGMAPSAYDWSPVFGFTVTVLHDGGLDEAILAQLARECVKAGAAKAYLISPSTGSPCRIFEGRPTHEQT